MTDRETLRRIITLRAYCFEENKCYGCQKELEVTHYGQYGDDGYEGLLCKECSKIEITEEDVKGDDYLEMPFSVLMRKKYGP